MEPLNLTRAERLEIRRKRIKGLTQHQLGEAAGLHPVYAADVLRGARGGEDALDALERALADAEERETQRSAA